jgi:hypothetical protein
MMRRPPSGAGMSAKLGDVGIFGFGHFRVFSLTQWIIWIYHIWMIIIFPLNGGYLDVFGGLIHHFQTHPYGFS